MKRKRSFLYILFIFITIIGIYGTTIESQLVDVNHIWLSESQVGGSLQGKTAIHLSDLHISRVGRREKKVLQIITEINPDFIFLTGDYVKWKGDYEPSLDFLKLLEAKAGVWAVMGDYDYSNSRKSCLFCHEPGTGLPTTRHSVHFLRNSYQKMAIPDGDVFIGGIEKEEESELPTIEEPSIILSHSPLLFDELDNDCGVLMLSGDTHGGQVLLPGWLWKLIGYEKASKYSHGLFQDGNKTLYVSKGIGTSHFPIRLFRRPEIVVLHF